MRVDRKQLPRASSKLADPDVIFIHAIQQSSDREIHEAFIVGLYSFEKLARVGELYNLKVVSHREEYNLHPAWNALCTLYLKVFG